MSFFFHDVLKVSGWSNALFLFISLVGCSKAPEKCLSLDPALLDLTLLSFLLLANLLLLDSLFLVSFCFLFSFFLEFLVFSLALLIFT